MEKSKIVSKLVKEMKEKVSSGKRDFERTEFEDEGTNTDFQQYNDDNTESIVQEENNKRKEIRITKKKLLLAGGAALIGLLIFGNKTNQREDAVYKWGKTNNIETVELKKGFEVKSGTDIIQEIHGDDETDVTTMILTKEGLQDITKYDKKFPELNISFFKKGIVSANEAHIEFEPMDGQKSYSKEEKELLEADEVLIYPDYFLYQNGMFHIRNLRTGKEGWVPSLAIETGEEIEFIPSDESPLYVVCNVEKKKAYIRESKHVYEGSIYENVVGDIGSYDGEMEYTIVTLDKDNNKFYDLLNFTDKELNLYDDEVVKLFELNKDGMVKQDGSIILHHQDESKKIEDKHFVFGVVENEAVVGKGFFSKGKTITPRSLYFEFKGEQCMAITPDGLVSFSSNDKEKLRINYVQTGTAFGNGKSIPVKNEEGENIYGKYVVDYKQVTTLPESSIEKPEGTLIPIYGGFLWESEIPDLDNLQISSDSELFILKAKEDIPIRTSKQARNGYDENIIDTIPQGDYIIVKVNEDGVYEVVDLRFPELNGGLIVDNDRITIEFKIIANRIEEQEHNEEKKEEDEQGEKTSFNDDFKKEIKIEINGKNGNNGNNSDMKYMADNEYTADNEEHGQELEA